MNPIPPTKLIRRERAKRYHLYDLASAPDRPRTECGQTIHRPIERTAYDAGMITCDECLTRVISRKLGERSAREAARA